MMSSDFNFLEKEIENFGLKANNNQYITADLAFENAQKLRSKIRFRSKKKNPFANDNYVDCVYYYYLSSFLGNKQATEEVYKLNESLAKFEIEALTYLNYNALFKEEELDLQVYRTIYSRLAEHATLVDILEFRKNTFSPLCFPSYLAFFLQKIDEVYGKTNFLYPFSKFVDIPQYNYRLYKGSDIIEILLNTLFHLVFDDLSADFYPELDLTILLGMNAESAYKLGVAFYHGIDIEKRIDLSIIFFIYAALCGQVKAYLYLATLFTNYKTLSLTQGLSIPLLLKQAYVILSTDDDAFSKVVNLKQNIVVNGVEYDLAKEIFYNFLIAYRTSIDIESSEPKAAYDVNQKQELQTFFEFMTNYVFEELDERNDYKIYAALANFYRPKNPDYDVCFNIICQIYGHNKSDRKYSHDEVFRNLLKFGLVKNDPLAIHSYCMAILMQDAVKANDEKYLQLAIKCGFADIVYAYAAYLHKDHKHVKANQELFYKYINLAASLGNASAQYILSLDLSSSKAKEFAIENGYKAMQRGMVVANYSLYLAYKEKNVEIAHTYLFYAAEYGYLPAVETLKQLIVKNEFKPFSFIRTMRKIMDRCGHDDNACMFMYLIYHYGGLVPRNEYKALQYLHLALARGCVFPYGAIKYSDLYVYPSRDGDPCCSTLGHLASYKEGLTSLCDFYHADSIEKLKFDEGLANIFAELLENLIKADHPLIYRALKESLHTPLWRAVLPETSIDKIFEVIKNKAHLWDDFEQIYESTLFSFESFMENCLVFNEERYDYALEVLKNTPQDNAATPLIKGMICLRPVAAKADTFKAYKYFVQSFNAGNIEAESLSFYSYNIFNEDLSSNGHKISEPLNDIKMLAESFVEQ